jgi:hypothetical protein
MQTMIQIWCCMKDSHLNVTICSIEKTQRHLELARQKLKNIQEMERNALKEIAKLEAMEKKAIESIKYLALDEAAVFKLIEISKMPCASRRALITYIECDKKNNYYMLGLIPENDCCPAKDQ